MIKRFLSLSVLIAMLWGCCSVEDTPIGEKTAVYKVEHYQQNANDDGYTLVEADSENKNGTTGKETSALAKTYEGFTAKTVDQVKITADGSAVVKIYYDRNEITLTLDLAGGEGQTEITGKYGAAVSVTAPTKTGYDFVSWNPELPKIFPAESATYTATWTVGTGTAYKVEHYQQNIDNDEYTLVEADTENKKGTTDENTSATAKDYAGFTAKTVDQVKITADGSAVVKIYYDRNEITLTLDLAGGEGQTEITGKYGAAVSVTAPTKTGYDFVSWNPELPVTFPAESATYTATWDANIDTAYTVEHYQQNIADDEYTLAEDGTENKTGTTDENTSATAKDYAGFTAKTVEQVKITEDGKAVVKIYYDRNIITLTLDLVGGKGETEITGKYGADVTTPVNPTKTGYIFAGWNPELPETFPAESATYKAKWVENPPTGFAYVEGATITTQIADSQIFTGSSVTVSDFYISDHEVTQAEYEKYCTYGSSSPSDTYGDGDNYPVYYVSWFDALVYCNKRSIAEDLTPCYTINGSTDPKDWGDVPTSTSHENWDSWWAVTCDFTKNGYRLPTEAEWEYAARGGKGLSGTQYTYAGSDNINEVAWYWDNSGETTHPVAQKKANGLGLYDMSGNVWEWCWDSRGSRIRYLRGGSWHLSADNCTVSLRYDGNAYLRSYGFRVVRTAR